MKDEVKAKTHFPTVISDFSFATARQSSFAVQQFSFRRFSSFILHPSSF